MQIKEMVKRFYHGECPHLDGERFLFKIKENNEYTTYYTVSFSQCDGYNDIFLSSAIVHHGDTLLHECNEGHHDDYMYARKCGLYERLGTLPMQNINDTPFIYDYQTGTHIHEAINMDDVPYV